MTNHGRAGGIALALATVISLSQCRESSISENSDALPAGVDLSAAQVVEVRNQGGEVVLSGTFVDHKASLASADPNGSAKGMAEFEVEKEGNGTEQEFEASIEGLPASSAFTVFVDGKQVSAFTTSDDGKRSMKLKRKDGA